MVCKPYLVHFKPKCQNTMEFLLHTLSKSPLLLHGDPWIQQFVPSYTSVLKDLKLDFCSKPSLYILSPFHCM